MYKICWDYHHISNKKENGLLARTILLIIVLT